MVGGASLAQGGRGRGMEGGLLPAGIGDRIIQDCTVDGLWSDW